MFTFKLACILLQLIVLVNCNKMAANYDDRTVFAMTVFGEASGEIEKGQRAVAWVIINRAGSRNPKAVRDVCLAPYQFECWNNQAQIDRINTNIKRDPKGYAKILKMTNDILAGGNVANPIGRIKYYNNPAKGQCPAHLVGKKAKYIIGNHHFYDLESNNNEL